MKIGILIDRLNIGGVEKIAIEEVVALKKIGVDAELVVMREKGVVADVFPDLLKNTPITYLDKRLPRLLRLSFSFPFFHFFSLFHLTYPLVLPFVVKRREYDYIISHGTYTSLTAIALKKTRGIRFSAFMWDPATYIIDRVYSHDHNQQVIKILKFITTRLDRFLISNMDKVLVGGAAHNNFIHTLIPGKAVQTIHPSVHPTKKLSTKEPYVVIVTAWKKGKHPEYLIDIAHSLPNVHIKMVGKWIDPEYRKEFEAAVANEGLAQQIEITGGVSEQELSRLYAKARLLLQTNDDRGFGMPAFEAAAQGTTFIIPEGQGVCELFTNGVEGFYTREKDTPKITSLIKPLMEDEELAVRMGALAWNTVRDSYSWESHARQLHAVAQSCVG